MGLVVHSESPAPLDGRPRHIELEIIVLVCRYVK
jgi:hypothetical protein